MENIRKEKINLNYKNILKEYIFITIGCIMMAAGVALFLLPNELSTGGFAGIGTITYYLFKIPLGTTMLLLNVPLLIIAYFRIGKKLLFRSIYGTAIFSILVDIFDIFKVATNDRLLACIYGGILIGIGTAIILKYQASTGGSDLLSYLIKSFKKEYRTSNIIFLIDFTIIALNVVFFKEVEVGLYSAIAIFLMGKMIDLIFEGVNFTKVVLIISSNYNEIARVIGDEISRGSTGIYAKGMYSNDQKMMLLCVGSRTEAYAIEDIAKRNDENSFVIILNAREVLGKGFK